jgi:hypothetical protein
MLAARVRERLSRLQFAGAPISATVGITVYPADGATAHALLAHADGRLLGGRFRSRHAGPAHAALGSDEVPSPRPEPRDPSLTPAYRAAG